MAERLDTLIFLLHTQMTVDKLNMEIMPILSRYWALITLIPY